jgi:hypothetical protein
MVKAREVVKPPGPQSERDSSRGISPQQLETNHPRLSDLLDSQSDYPLMGSAHPTVMKEQSRRVSDAEDSSTLEQQQLALSESHRSQFSQLPLQTSPLPVDGNDPSLTSCLQQVSDPATLGDTLHSALLSECTEVAEMILSRMVIALSPQEEDSELARRFLDKMVPDCSRFGVLIRICRPSDAFTRLAVNVLSLISSLDSPPSAPPSPIHPPDLAPLPFPHRIAEKMIKSGLCKDLLSLLEESHLADLSLQHAIALLRVLITHSAGTQDPSMILELTDLDFFSDLLVRFLDDEPRTHETLSHYLDLLSSLCSVDHLSTLRASAMFHQNLCQALALLTPHQHSLFPPLCRILKLILLPSPTSPLHTTQPSPPQQQQSQWTLTYFSFILRAVELSLERCTTSLLSTNQLLDDCDECTGMVFACALRYPEKLFAHIPSSRYKIYGAFFASLFASLASPTDMSAVHQHIFSTSLAILEQATSYKEMIILCLHYHLPDSLTKVYSKFSQNPAWERTIRVLYSRLTGRHRQYLVAISKPSLLAPDLLRSILDSNSTMEDCWSDESPLSVDRDTVSPLSPGKPSPPNGPRRSWSTPKTTRVRLLSAPALETEASSDTSSLSRERTPQQTEREHHASEIIQRCLRRVCQRKLHQRLTLDPFTKQLTPADLESLKSLLPRCCDVSFLCEVIAVASLTRQEELCEMSFKRIAHLSRLKRSCAKRLSEGLLRRMTLVLNLMLSFSDNASLIEEGCTVMQLILSHPSHPKRIFSKHSSLFFHLFYLCVEKYSLNTLLCLEIISLGVKYAKTKSASCSSASKEGPEHSAGTEAAIAATVAAVHRFPVVIQTLKFYSSHLSPHSDRLVELTCQYLCYCIQADPPLCQDLIRSHGGCEVLTTLLSEGAPGLAANSLQTISHLITNLMTRNNKNSRLFASQHNLSGYFLGMERGIRTLNPPLVMGISSIICRIFSRKLALYAMYHPEADIDLAGGERGSSSRHATDSQHSLTGGHPLLLSAPSPLVMSTTAKIHIPSHLSHLIHLILTAHAPPSSTLVPCTSSQNQHDHDHISEEDLRTLRELLYATLKLIEFFSVQHILRASFRSYRQLLVAVTAMTVESKLCCAKITGLAKRVASCLRAC